jgi:phospholipid/cholesterol/gamma-HCH transport system substrate-binding protein
VSRLRAVVAAAAMALLTGGCGFHGVYSLPLPGAAGTGPNTYTVDVQFTDVLDLVPYSAVKVNGATVGHVTAIAVQGHHAVVGCRLPDAVRLPANAIARVEQTSVLGEKFVEIEPPVGEPAVGRLGNGDVIPIERTDTDASVEEVLGALSMLLNGGGVGQLQTITHELSTALHGRTGVTRDLLHHLDVFAGGLDRQKQAIVDAMEGLNRLARTVRQQEATVVDAVQHMPRAVRILAGDRRQLTTMLTSLDHLGAVATHVVNASHADLVANLRHLRPTLDRLSRVGGQIPEVLTIIATYPTADSVEQEYFGDYGNLSLTLDVSAQSLLNTFGPGVLPPGGAPTKAARGDRSNSTQPGAGLTSQLPVPLPSGSPTRWLPGTTLDDLLLGVLS